MVRLKFDIELRYEIAEQASDFILNIHAAHTACQTVVSEKLRLSHRCRMRSIRCGATATDICACRHSRGN